MTMDEWVGLARRVLECCEWKCYDYDNTCPVCEQPQSCGHDEDCQMKQLLDQEYGKAG